MCGRITTPWRRANATHLPHATQHDAPSGDVHRQNVPVASEPAVRGATFAEVFGVSEFRVFWLAQALSVAGDRLALGALAGVGGAPTPLPVVAAPADSGGVPPAGG